MRWAFTVIAAVALSALFDLAESLKLGEGRSAGIRAVVNRRMLMLGLVALTQAIGPGGVQLLVALVSRDVLSLSGSATGASSLAR